MVDCLRELKREGGRGQTPWGTLDFTDTWSHRCATIKVLLQDQRPYIMNLWLSLISIAGTTSKIKKNKTFSTAVSSFSYYKTINETFKDAMMNISCGCIDRNCTLLFSDPCPLVTLLNAVLTSTNLLWVATGSVHVTLLRDAMPKNC